MLFYNQVMDFPDILVIFYNCFITFIVPSGAAHTANPMAHKGYGFKSGAYPYFHDLLGCIPSCLQNFLVPDPAQFPSPPSTKSSEFPLSPPPPVCPEVQLLVAHGLTILNQHFQKTAAAVSVHRSRSQRYLNDKPCQNRYFTDLPNSTGKKLHKACSSLSAFFFSG